MQLCFVFTINFTQHNLHRTLLINNIVYQHKRIRQTEALWPL